MGTIPNQDVQFQDGTFCTRADGQYRIAVVLAADIAKTIDIPVDDDSGQRANQAFFVYEAGSVYVDFTPAGDPDVVAAIPSGDITDGAAPDLNPTTRYVKHCSKISMISATAQVVVISFYL